MVNPISEAVADQIFEDDLMEALKGTDQLRPWMPKGISHARLGVLIEMIFQLGIGGVLKFKKMLEALKTEDYDRAADEMLDSLAARQTPERWAELSKLMREG